MYKSIRVSRMLFSIRPTKSRTLELTLAGCIENDFKTIIPYGILNLTHTLIQVTQS